MKQHSFVNLPLSVPALRVDQPMGVFYVTVLSARFLTQVCFSDRLRITGQSDSSYQLEGNQRQLDERRLRAIGEYISRADAAFPNTIILAANSRYEDGLVEEIENERWTVTESPGGAGHLITIPTLERRVAIIDGQHRLRSFDFAIPERIDMPLVCSVFFDLNKPFQAQLFATINSTQKPVDRSLTFELFGYNVSEEPEDSWSPDKLAVFLTRKLNTEDGSPLRGRVTIAPEGDLLLRDASNDFRTPEFAQKRLGITAASVERDISGHLPKPISLEPPKRVLRMIRGTRWAKLPKQLTERWLQSCELRSSGMAGLNPPQGEQNQQWLMRGPHASLFPNTQRLKSRNYRSAGQMLPLELNRFFDSVFDFSATATGSISELSTCKIEIFSAGKSIHEERYASFLAVENFGTQEAENVKKRLNSHSLDYERTLAGRLPKCGSTGSQVVRNDGVKHPIVSFEVQRTKRGLILRSCNSQDGAFSGRHLLQQLVRILLRIARDQANDSVYDGCHRNMPVFVVRIASQRGFTRFCENGQN